MAPSAHNNLVIFGPKGDKVADLAIPTISQAVTVGSTSFQISYGKDANNFITAIIAPSSSQPQDLHFTVLGKTVDADKQAVITLTFPDPKRVIIDPGYIGAVTVDSHPMKHRQLASDAPAAPAPTPSPRVAANDVQPRDTPSPAVHEAPAPVQHPVPVVHHTAKTTVKRETASTSTPSPATPAAPLPSSETSGASLGGGGDAASVPIAPPPLLGSLMAQPLPPKPPSSGSTAPSQKMYWAEPITPPNGAPPSVGIDQMKLVAVHGAVTVKTPGGDTKTATDGMLVPSGSSITTADQASAAVFIGGVDSARLLPNTDAKVTENLNNSTRHTNITLKNGTVFSRVGHRPGEKQDFQVTTPQGVAAARGTSYAVSVTTAGGKQVTVVATQDGVVTLTDANGHVITITPINASQVAVGSIPNDLPADQITAIFTSFLAQVQQFNTNMQAIANNPSPTPAEAAYYANNAGFDTNTQFYDANSGSITAVYTNPNADIGAQVNENNVNNVVPGARRASNQMLEPFGTIPLTPF